MLLWVHTVDLALNTWHQTQINNQQTTDGTWLCLAQYGIVVTVTSHGLQGRVLISLECPKGKSAIFHQFKCNLKFIVK